MEARIARIVVRLALLAAAACVVIAWCSSASAASYRTQNFLASAPTPQLAETICRTAEQYRHDLAVEWLGRELPPWPNPCPITATVAENLGAGGATSFIFEHGQVGGWQMSIQGSVQRILDSVLPHEITHTIFATHFREPLPRWADEGACTTVEHADERGRHEHMLITFLQTGRGIAMSRLFAMKDYPQDVLPLYAQGYSVARYLIEQGGRKKFVAFVGDGLQDENWPRAMQKFYGDQTLLALQNRWLDWVRQGSPHLMPQPEQPGRAPVMVASHTSRTRPDPNLIYREPAQDRTRVAAATSNESQPPMVPIAHPVDPAGYQVAAANGPAPQYAAATARPAPAAGMWHAPGGAARLASREDVVAEGVPAEPQPYQAIRQQPPQQPVPTVIEP